MKQKLNIFSSKMSNLTGDLSFIKTSVYILLLFNKSDEKKMHHSDQQQQT